MFPLGVEWNGSTPKISPLCENGDDQKLNSKLRGEDITHFFGFPSFSEWDDHPQYQDSHHTLATHHMKIDPETFTLHWRRGFLEQLDIKKDELSMGSKYLGIF